ncbi:medium-chain acyl-CoA ligase ACSF2, mitochondrial [Scophthalmus maximus]|uniref:medium-chain acyl-CoA ligase ACSF2, mitochondrial n=1 Tax=Scophthalmus maximus TaxID=52904 RepID=UPI001FA8B776|nr:medium-chain acyl-CoA ligase ACSF2, mitochondrial [Scophthalmus maximus]
MAALISSSLLRCYARTLRSADGLKSCRATLLEGARSLHVDSRPQNPSLTSSYVHGTSTISLLPLTVGQSLDSAAERWPDREAVVFLQDGIRKTFAQFQQDVDKAAAGLLALGLKRGDRLGVWGPNTYEWVLFQFASAKAGIILVSLNPAYQVKEVEFTLKKVQCKAVVCPAQFKTQEFCEMLREICPEIDDSSPAAKISSSRLPDLRMVIVTDSRRPGMLHVEDVMQAGESRHRRELVDLQSKLSFDDPINIQFTSGTTGSPKGAVLSHHNIVNNAYFLGLRMGYPSRPQVRVCLPVPLYHCFGSVLGGMTMAVHGVTLVFPCSGYSIQANLEAIEREKCNLVYGTPTMFIDMLSQDLHKYDLSSVEAGIMAGSSCPPEIVRKLKTDMNMREITLGYGTTENSPVTFLGFPEDDDELKMNTTGCIMNHTEAKVVDPATGQIVPLGASGELMIRGGCVMHGYWDEPEKTSEVISQDRWYRTGDTASLNSLGYCQIEGRMKDLIIRGGENIYPAEIEQFLYTHPKVNEVQVVGVRDERLGEQVCACIRLNEGQTCSAEEVRAFCKGQISHFKIPHYVAFVESYPLTVSGKIKKNILKQDMEKKLGL